MEDTLVSLGLRIKKVRKLSGLKQELFGQQLGVSKSSVINYETGKRIPDALFLIRILENFNVDPIWLMLGTGDMPIRKNSGNSESADPSIIKEYRDLIEDMKYPIIKYGVMAEYKRLKEVYKPLIMNSDSQEENVEPEEAESV